MPAVEPTAGRLVGVVVPDELVALDVDDVPGLDVHGGERVGGGAALVVAVGGAAEKGADFVGGHGRLAPSAWRPVPC